jgi:hypothetical protein
MAINPDAQNFRTGDASLLLTTLGVDRSKSFLEKARTRGADDGRDRGPDFYRDENGVCWYPRYALETYAARCLAARKFREPAPQPSRFRRGDDQAA